MTAVREIKIKCDYGGCQDWIAPRVAPGQVAETVTVARKLARKQGWRTRKAVTQGVTNRVVKTEDRCPRHATI